MMLAKLGLRAGEVATLTHTLASWGSPVPRDRQITPVLQRFPDLMHGSAS
jgi:hypothetical protein